MTVANRVQLAFVREVTAGTTPNTPRMRTGRITSEALTFGPTYVDTDELRADRMLPDPIKVMVGSGGSVSFELSYPVNNTWLSDVFRSAFYNSWTVTAERDNDGTADSVITAVTASSDTYTVTTGTAFVEGQLVRATGFTNSGNNSIFRAQSGSGATSVVAPSSPGLTDEAAPPAAARLKVVGFQGASGDITATSTGLGSTALDFTTLGLAVGMWVKIGGTAAGDKFATADLNGWARISAIAATALTLDNRPSGWTTDSGTSKTIKVWFGDYIKNGTTQTSLSIEKGFLGQTVPTYILAKGMSVNELSFSFTSQQKITGQATFTGMGGSSSTTAQDASPDAATTNRIMAANANVSGLNEAGAAIAAANAFREITLTINNNQRVNDVVDQASPVAVKEGECTVTGRVNGYFGSDAILQKFYNNTASSLSWRATKDDQAIVFEIPRVTYRGGGNPQATGKNTDVMQSFDFQASYDSTTAAHILCNRLEYFEA